MELVEQYGWFQIAAHNEENEKQMNWMKNNFNKNSICCIHLIND